MQKISAAVSKGSSRKQHVGTVEVLKIKLRGEISFTDLLNLISVDFEIPCRLVHAQIEFVEHRNFGPVLLHLFGKEEQHNVLLQYLINAQIDSEMKSYT